MSEEEVNIHKPNIDDIEKFIKNGDTDKFLYQEETPQFEVRSKTYAINSQDKVQKEKAKQTFAQDITSIANSGGGYIVIGLTAKLEESRQIEYVEKVSGIKPDEIHIEQWRSVLRDFTVPRLTFESIKYGFIGDEKKVFWMRIPNAKELGMYPMLVRKSKWEVEEIAFLKGEMYGLFHRDGAENLLESADTVQQILAAGINNPLDNAQITTAQYQELSEQLESISIKLENSVKNSETNEVDTTFLENADQKLEEGNGYFYIQANPNIAITFPNFRDSEYKQDNIYTKMKDPPTLRRMGWGLGVAGSEFPRPNGHTWEITNGQRKLLQVSNTGQVFGAITIDDVLSWATDKYINEQTEADVLVSELALIEYIYNFCVFLDQLAKQNENVTAFSISTGFNIPESTKVGVLISERISVLWYQPGGLLGNQRKWEFNYDVSLSPEENAANISIEIIMGGFGNGNMPIMITKNEDGNYIVNTEFYIKILGG